MFWHLCDVRCKQKTLDKHNYKEKNRVSIRKIDNNSARTLSFVLYKKYKLKKYPFSKKALTQHLTKQEVVTINIEP